MSNGTSKIVRIRPAAPARPASQAKRATQLEAVAPKGRMTPPKWLPKEAGAHFRRIVKLLTTEGRASPSHVDSVALLAARLLEIEQCTVRIDEAGSASYETTTDRAEAPMVRALPEVAQRSEAMRHAHSLLVELGLTPAAAHRMLRDAAKEKEREENPFNDFA